MKLLLILSVTALMISCTTAEKKEPSTPPTQIPSSPASDDAISKIVFGSECSKHVFGNRGKPPIGYLKGLAHAYARSILRKDLAGTVMGRDLGNSSKDVLALYGFSQKDSLGRIRDLYTMMIGLGMRESSGWYGTGRDSSADNTSSNTAETGLFQQSYNLKDGMDKDGKDALALLYSEYSASRSLCLEGVFVEGKSSSKTMDTKYWSLSSETPANREAGLKFQQVTRECPALATEYAAVGLRGSYPHWGPAKRKEAEAYGPCRDMLAKVEEAMK